MANTKYDVSFCQMAKEFASDGRTDQAIAAMLGISRATFYTYRQQYPEFDDALVEGRGWIENALETRLMDLAMGRVQLTTTILDHEDRETLKTRTLAPNLRALLILLKKYGSEEWAEVLSTPKAPKPISDKPAWGSQEAIDDCRRTAEANERSWYADYDFENDPQNIRDDVSEEDLLKHSYFMPKDCPRKRPPAPPEDSAAPIPPGSGADAQRSMPQDNRRPSYGLPQDNRTGSYPAQNICQSNVPNSLNTNKISNPIGFPVAVPIFPGPETY